MMRGELLFARIVQRRGRGCVRQGAKRATSIAVIAPLIALWLSPTSKADPAEDLRTAVNAARQSCPPLQQDPVLDGVAARVIAQNQAYMSHTARFIPLDDPMPVLRELGYHANSAVLFQGYGDTVEKAVRGAVLQGWQAIPDCSNTKFGSDLSTVNGDVLSALVLTTD